MRIREFTIGTVHTINLGNYSSLKVEASLTVGVPEEFSMEEFYMLKQEANAELKTLLREVEQYQRRTKQTIEELTKAGA